MSSLRTQRERCKVGQSAAGIVGNVELGEGEGDEEVGRAIRELALEGAGEVGECCCEGEDEGEADWR